MRMRRMRRRRTNIHVWTRAEATGMKNKNNNHHAKRNYTENGRNRIRQTSLERKMKEERDEKMKQEEEDKMKENMRRMGTEDRGGGRGKTKETKEEETASGRDRYNVTGHDEEEMTRTSDFVETLEQCMVECAERGRRQLYAAHRLAAAAAAAAAAAPSAPTPGYSMTKSRAVALANGMDSRTTTTTDEGVSFVASAADLVAELIVAMDSNSIREAPSDEPAPRGRRNVMAMQRRQREERWREEQEVEERLPGVKRKLVHRIVDVAAAAQQFWGVPTHKLASDAYHLARRKRRERGGMRGSGASSSSSSSSESPMPPMPTDRSDPDGVRYIVSLCTTHASMRRCLLFAALAGEAGVEGAWMETSWPASKAFDLLAIGFARRGRWEDAVSVRDCMRELCKSRGMTRTRRDVRQDATVRNVSDMNAHADSSGGGRGGGRGGDNDDGLLLSECLGDDALHRAASVTHNAARRVWTSRQPRLLTCRPSPTSKTYRALILGANLSGYPQLARHYYMHDMAQDGVRPNIRVANMVLDGFSNVGDAQGANVFYKYIVNEQRMRPDIVTFNTLLKIGIGIRDAELQMTFAHSILRNMDSFGVHPDGNSFLSLCSIFMRAQNKDTAYQMSADVCFELKDRILAEYYSRVATPPAPGRRRLQLRNFFGSAQFTALINACAISRDPDRALAVHEEMVEMLSRDANGARDAHNYNSIDAVNALMKAMIRTQQWRRGAEIAMDMIACDGLVPDWRTAVQLIQCFGKDDQERGMEEAKAFLESHGMRPLCPEAYAACMGIYARKNRPWRVLALIHEMDSNNQQLRTLHFNELLRGYMRTKELDKAWEVLIGILGAAGGFRCPANFVNPFSDEKSGAPNYGLARFICDSVGGGDTVDGGGRSIASAAAISREEGANTANSEDNIFNIYARESRSQEVTYRLAIELSVLSRRAEVGERLYNIMTTRGMRCPESLRVMLFSMMADAEFSIGGNAHAEDEALRQAFVTTDEQYAGAGGGEFFNAILQNEEIKQGAQDMYGGARVDRMKVVVVDVDVGADAARTSVLTAIRSLKRKRNSGEEFTDLVVVIGSKTTPADAMNSTGGGAAAVQGSASGSHSADDGSVYGRSQIRQPLYRLLREELQLELTSMNNTSLLKSPGAGKDCIDAPVRQMIQDMFVFETILVKREKLEERFAANVRST